MNNLSFYCMWWIRSYRFTIGKRIRKTPAKKKQWIFFICVEREIADWQPTERGLQKEYFPILLKIPSERKQQKKVQRTKYE